MTRKTMAAIFGYGHSVDEDKKLFLDQIIQAIVSGEIDAVIASGGCTSRKNNPRVSEAAIIYAYLYGKLIEKGYRLVPRFWMGKYCSPFDLQRISSICGIYPQKEEEKLQEIDFYFEDCARTTRENVLFMKSLLKRHKAWEDYELVAYCNQTHWVKIAALTACVWHYVPRAVLDSKGNSKEFLKQLVVTIPTVLALKSKVLRDLENNRREKQMDEK